MYPRKKYRRNGRLRGHGMPESKYDKGYAGEQQEEVLGVHDNNEKKRIIADRDLRHACMDYEKINEHDRHTKAARRQMEHQPYQADFRSHIMGRFERVK